MLINGVIMLLLYGVLASYLLLNLTLNQWKHLLEAS